MKTSLDQLHHRWWKLSFILNRFFFSLKDKLVLKFSGSHLTKLLSQNSLQPYFLRKRNMLLLKELIFQ